MFRLRPLQVSEEPMISVPIDNENTITSLDDLLVAKRGLLLNLTSEEAHEPVESDELAERLERRETQLLIAQAELSQLRSDIHSEDDELRKMEGRREFIRNDIQRNKDIKRLRDFGVEAGLSISEDRCPTCNQSVSDTLVLTEASVMGVEENISFLQTEAEAVGLLISAGQERLAQLRSVKVLKSQGLDDARAAIRDLRSDLLQNRDISVAAIREEVQLQEEIARLEQLRDEFVEDTGRLRAAAERWQSNRVRRSELPDDYFSRRDRQKLTTLSNEFSRSVVNFGYLSSGVSALHISEDNYRPVCDDFEVAFGASASDNIRLIWAYTLALLQVSLIPPGGNHWCVIIFDEPEQQRMSDASSDALYRAVATIPREACQVIVATSATEELTRRRLLGLPHKLLEYGTKVVRPISASSQ